MSMMKTYRNIKRIDRYSACFCATVRDAGRQCALHHTSVEGVEDVGVQVLISLLGDAPGVVFPSEGVGEVFEVGNRLHSCAVDVEREERTVSDLQTISLVFLMSRMRMFSLHHSPSGARKTFLYKI